MIDEVYKYFAGKRVLVTGHTGFKGSWLSIWLLQMGADVIGFARAPKTLNDNFVLAALDKKMLSVIGDIRNAELLSKIINVEKPEIVFHLAAQPLVLESYANPIETFETNIIGTAYLVQACRDNNNVKDIIVITTDKVYENKSWDYGYREIDRLGGYDPYSSSKAAAELVVASLRNSFLNPRDFSIHGKSLATVRAGNVVGGGDWSENRIIPDCIRALENNKSIQLRNPYSTRPWQFVLEPLWGYLILASKMHSDPEIFASAWNFGPRYINAIPVITLVDKLVQKYGNGTWHESTSSSRPHEASFLSLDIAKAEKYLQWRPILTCDKMIDFVVDWYKSYKNESVYEICTRQIESFMEIWKSRQEN